MTDRLPSLNGQQHHFPSSPGGRLTYGIFKPTKHDLIFVAVTLDENDAKLYRLENRKGARDSLLWRFRCRDCKQHMSEVDGKVKHLGHNRRTPCKQHLPEAIKSVGQWAAFRAYDEAKAKGFLYIRPPDWQRWMRRAGCQMPEQPNSEEWKQVIQFVEYLEKLSDERWERFKERVTIGEHLVQSTNLKEPWWYQQPADLRSSSPTSTAISSRHRTTSPSSSLSSRTVSLNNTQRTTVDPTPPPYESPPLNTAQHNTHDQSPEISDIKAALNDIQREIHDLTVYAEDFTEILKNKADLLGRKLDLLMTSIQLPDVPRTPANCNAQSSLRQSSQCPYPSLSGPSSSSKRTAEHLDEGTASVPSPKRAHLQVYRKEREIPCLLRSNISTDLHSLSETDDADLPKKTFEEQQEEDESYLLVTTGTEMIEHQTISHPDNESIHSISGSEIIHKNALLYDDQQPPQPGAHRTTHGKFQQIFKACCMGIGKLFGNST